MKFAEWHDVTFPSKKNTSRLHNFSEAALREKTKAAACCLQTGNDAAAFKRSTLLVISRLCTSQCSQMFRL